MVTESPVNCLQRELLLQTLMLPHPPALLFQTVLPKCLRDRRRTLKKPPWAMTSLLLDSLPMSKPFHVVMASATTLRSKTPTFAHGTAHRLRLLEATGAATESAMLLRSTRATAPKTANKPT